MNHSTRFLTCSALLLILISSIPSFAQEDPRLWDVEGVPLRLGDHLEWSGSSAVNDQGQTCVTWSDAREGYWDIYAQVIASNGSQIGSNQGVVVNDASWRQEQPTVIAVDDGWIVAWLDWRYGDRFHYSNPGPRSALFAQKLSLSGERLWPDEGVEVYLSGGASIRDESIRLTNDQNGGAIIGWQQYVSGVGYVFKTQHLNSSGSLLWDDPVLTINLMDRNSDIQVEPDNAGNMLLVWMADVDTTTVGVFAAKISPDGELLWGDESGRIRLDPGHVNCYYFQLCRDKTNDGFYLTWCDRGTSYSDLYHYSQRFDVNGTPLWDPFGILLYEADDEINFPIIAPSFSGEEQDGFLLLGRHREQTTTSLIAQKVDASGAFLWGDYGIDIGDIYTYGAWDIATVQTDFSGGCIALWNQEFNDPDNDLQRSLLKSARIDDSGASLWGDGGTTIHNRRASWRYQGAISYVQDSDYVRLIYQDASYFGYKSILFADGSQITESAVPIKPAIWGESYGPTAFDLDNSRVAVLWIDDRNGYFYSSIYMQVIDTLGTPLLGANGTQLNLGDDIMDFSRYRAIEVCSDGDGGFFGASTIYSGSTHPLVLFHITFDEGTDYTLSQTMVTDSARGYDDWFHLTPDGSGGCFLAWSRYTPDFETEAAIQRFDDNCEPLWQSPVVIPLTIESRLTKLEQTSDNCCIAVYYSERDDIRRIGAAKINQSGSILWSTFLDSDMSNSPSIDCQSDGNGGMYFCWDRTHSDEDPGIYLQHAYADGSLQWSDNGIQVDSTNGWEPQLLYDEQYGIYVIWKYGDGMLAQRIDLDGTMLWAVEGLQLSDDNYAYSTNMMLNGEGGLFCIWTQQDMYGESALFGMDLTPDGTPTSTWWQTGTGSALSTDERFVNYTQLTPFHDGSSLIVWEGQVWGEEKSGSDPDKPNFYYYIDIFAQRIAIGENTLDIDAAPNSIPKAFSLHQNYPNPFNPSTTISFAIPKAGQTSLVVYDLLGRSVETLMNKPLSAGSYHVSWDAGALPSGVYFYRLTAGEFSDVKKTVLLK